MKTSLYYREGNSDKEYHIEVVPAVAGLFLVNFAFGRRGSTLNTGSKTPAPVDEARAKDIFAKLARSMGILRQSGEDDKGTRCVRPGKGGHGGGSHLHRLDVL